MISTSNTIGAWDIETRAGTLGYPAHMSRRLAGDVLSQFSTLLVSVDCRGLDEAIHRVASQSLAALFDASGADYPAECGADYPAE